MKTAWLLFLALATFGVLDTARAAVDSGRFIAQGRLIGVNGQVCRGTVSVFEQAGSGGDCEYFVGLQHFSVSSTASLEVVPLADSAVLTPPYFVLRSRAGNQTYVFRGACGAIWQQIEIVDLSRSPPSEQTQCVAPFAAVASQ